MKQIIALALVLGTFACKEKVKEQTKSIKNAMAMEAEDAPSAYPEEIQKVLEAHGGLANWRDKRTLVFEIPDSKEIHTTDIVTRKDRIDAPAYSMGYDGKEVWVLEKEGTYEGNAGFYHNLMFYFYAMPFVLADSGINYGKAGDLQFEGKGYPGIKISFDNGIGASSNDQYRLHYYPETHEMAWLGYTVTYMSGERSDNVRWIRYDDWMKVNGVSLPKSMTWYNYEGMKIKEPKNTISFTNVSLSEKAKPDSFYDKPEDAKVVMGK